MKIDVEGAETDVLRGADYVLSTLRPQLVIEVHKHNYNTFKFIMSEHRYDVIPLIVYNTRAYYYAIPKQ